MGASTDSDATETERGPGRPREPAVDRRILDAALRLMAQSGYVRMTMDQVAALADVTKATIYRRYPSKIQLALAAIASYCDQAPPVYTGDTRSDLIAQMENFRHGLDRPHGMAMLGTVLAEEHATPELLARFREYLVAPRRTAIRVLLERACNRAELHPNADLELAENMLVGSYYAHYLAGYPFPADWATRVVDAVLAGIKA
ncbi:transcriptional regulator, TetR family [Oscillochloris trichoides DG-6]|uniref:Transcriptional regulator, TetR family n=1 Tax=Oscillochloris trichoides DG-6 TaxID=765420 RepID=E1IDX4_9CHLR|nr:TetR/AcrR family transcriptional regulator [Oscillochloris trichoides]EFO80585.1 transcriptional regulator, TetR family [Oscillochloris trichoides DG-6]